MPKEVLSKEAAGDMSDFFSCPDGKPHLWEYLGKDKQQYRCVHCGRFAHKAELKEVTD